MGWLVNVWAKKSHNVIGQKVSHQNVDQQASLAIARKPRDAEAVCFSLKHKCKSSQGPKAMRHSSRIPSRKQGHSGSLKAIYFWITRKYNEGLLSYNNYGLFSEDSEDIATESNENCRFWLPHCRLTPSSENPANIRTVVTLLEDAGATRRP